MSIDQIRALLATEVNGMSDQRVRLLALIGMVETYVEEEEGQLDEDERSLWLTRRRAWLMELAAIEQYLGLPRSVLPKGMRRDGRVAHGQEGQDRRVAHGLDRRGAEPI